MLNSKKQDDFGKAKTLLPQKCRICKWNSKCFGGCTKDRIKDPADNHQPRFCKSYIMFFEHADNELKKMASQWKQQQADHRERMESRGVYNSFKDFMKKV
jgi:uncharacterized protein